MPLDDYYECLHHKKEVCPLLCFFYPPILLRLANNQLLTRRYTRAARESYRHECSSGSSRYGHSSRRRPKCDTNTKSGIARQGREHAKGFRASLDGLGPRSSSYSLAASLNRFPYCLCRFHCHQVWSELPWLSGVRRATREARSMCTRTR